MRRCDSDQTFELQSQSKTVSIKNQVKKSHNPFLFNNIGDGTFLLQAIPGGTGTRPQDDGAHERTIHFFFFEKIGCCSRFRLQLIAIYCNRWRVCRQYTSHVTFSLAQRTCFMMCETPHWLKCLHERVISSAWSSTLCGCPFFDSLFLTLFLSVCFSYPFLFYLDTDLNLFLHVVDIRAINHWHSAN